MIEGAVFIGLVVVALVQLVKCVRVKDWDSVVTILSGAILGALVGIFDTRIGVVDISVAQGIMVGLGAVGGHTVARQIG